MDHLSKPPLKPDSALAHDCLRSYANGPEREINPLPHTLHPAETKRHLTLPQFSQELQIPLKNYCRLSDYLG